MDPLTISLIAGGVLGALKGSEQQRQYKDMQKIEALKQKWSPFTGLRGQNMPRPSSTDPLMQGLVSGALIGKQFPGGGAPGGAAQTGNIGQSAAPGMIQNNPSFMYQDPYGNPMPQYANV